MDDAYPNEPRHNQAASSSGRTVREVYEVYARDRVVRLQHPPHCDVGAPLPTIVATEHHLQPGSIAQPQDPSEAEVIAVATFTRPYAHMLGPLNDEAFDGRPLARRGLDPLCHVAAVTLGVLLDKIAQQFDPGEQPARQRP